MRIFEFARHGNMLSVSSRTKEIAKVVINNRRRRITIEPARRLSRQDRAVIYAYLESEKLWTVDERPVAKVA